MQYVGLIYPQHKYIMFIASCIFQFRAFHVIGTSFICYLFFQYNGIQSSFMRLSLMLFLFTVTCLKPFLQSICAINATPFGFRLSSCHTFTLFYFIAAFSFTHQFFFFKTNILSQAKLVPYATFRARCFCCKVLLNVFICS